MVRDAEAVAPEPVPAGEKRSPLPEIQSDRAPNPAAPVRAVAKTTRAIRPRSEERPARYHRRYQRQRPRRDLAPTGDPVVVEDDDLATGEEATASVATAPATSHAPDLGSRPVILTDAAPDIRNGRRRAGSPADRTSHGAGTAKRLRAIQPAPTRGRRTPKPIARATGNGVQASPVTSSVDWSPPEQRLSAFHIHSPTDPDVGEAADSALRLRMLAEARSAAVEGLGLRLTENLAHIHLPRVMTDTTTTTTTTAVGAPAPAFAIFSAAMGQFSPATYTVDTGVPDGVPVAVPEFASTETEVEMSSGATATATATATTTTVAIASATDDRGRRDEAPQAADAGTTSTDTVASTSTLAPLDLTSPAASIVVGEATTAGNAMPGDDFYTSVVMLYGSEMTILPTQGEGDRELLDRLARSVNAMDTTMMGGKFRTHGTARRHISAYRRRLWTVAAEYGREMGSASHWPYDTPDGMPLARYYRGSIHFTAQIRPGPPYRPMPDANPCVWTLVLTPRLRRMPEGRWLLTSLRGAPAVCQPVVTRGGHVGSVLMAFHEERVPATDQLTRVEMTAVLFLPSRPRGSFGVRIRELEPQEVEAEQIVDRGLMSPVRRRGGMLTAMFSGLRWRVRSRCNELRQLKAVATAYFECLQEPGLWREADCWCPGAPAVYELEDCEVRIEIETLATLNAGQRLCGTLIVTDTAPTGAAPPVERLPTMAVLNLHIYGPRERRPTFIFARNPQPVMRFPPMPAEPLTVGDAEWGAEPVTVASPYQLTARDGRVQVVIDVHYVCAPHGPARQWLVSSPFSETRFYTILSVWTSEEPLRLTLVSPRPDLVLPRGTVVAALYPIEATTGDVRRLGDRAALRLTENEEGLPSLCVGDLRLPPENFPCYDDM